MSQEIAAIRHHPAAIRPQAAIRPRALVFLFLSCLVSGGLYPIYPNGTSAGAQPAEEQAWVELKGGLRYLDLEVGEGEPSARPGRVVQVHYTGWLADGTRFQSSHDSGASFAFELGAGQVIAGWEKGMRGMRPGGRRRLEIPAKMAYGKKGRPGIIPPNATLTFDIELLSVR